MKQVSCWAPRFFTSLSVLWDGDLSGKKRFTYQGAELIREFVTDIVSTNVASEVVITLLLPRLFGSCT